MDRDRIDRITSQIREMAEEKGLKDTLHLFLDNIDFHPTADEVNQFHEYSENSIVRMLELQGVADMLAQVAGRDPYDMLSEMLEDDVIKLDTMRVCALYPEIFAPVITAAQITNTTNIELIVNTKLICDFVLDWIEGEDEDVAQQPEFFNEHLFYSGLDMGPEFSLN